LIRSFSLRHLLLVLHLQKEGIALCLEEALTQPISPLREALISYLFPRGTGIRTYILDYRENGQQLLGFAQIRTRYGLPESEVVYIAPALVDGNGTYATWQRLLTHLCVVAGEQGQQRLYAHTACDGEEQRLFRHVGFMPYTYEDIYRLDRRPPFPATQRGALRPQTVGDSWGVQRLYAAISPRFVQQIEGSARGQWEIRGSLWGGQGNRRGYVVEEQGEILACLQLRRGHQGSWLKILLHPQAYDWADSLVQQGVHLPGAWSSCATVGGEGPLYCSIRDYEGGLRAALDRFGFQFFARQAVMVKHTTVWAKEPLPKLLPALETRVEGAAPTVSNFWRSCAAKGGEGRAADGGQPPLGIVGENKMTMR
jgi:hypothetical protein